MSIGSCICPHLVSELDCCVFIENVLPFGKICFLHSSGFLLPLCIYLYHPGVVVCITCVCTHAQPYLGEPCSLSVDLCELCSSVFSVECVEELRDLTVVLLPFSSSKILFSELSGFFLHNLYG